MIIHPRLSGATLDRAAELRTDRSAVRALLRDPRARFVGASADAVLVDDGGSQPRLLRRTLDGQINPHRPILLGLEDGHPLFAADVSEPEAAAISDATGVGRLIALREAGMILPQDEGGLAAYLVALLGWHRTHRFCAVCGAPTVVGDAGLSRRCPSCGASHFPRTDPVVIMLVEHDGRLLIGRRLGWGAGRASLLAGFVASGETPEEAVIREVYEESGIVVEEARYIASQPWPFPASLMLGFEARARAGVPVPQPGEMREVMWVTRAQLQAAQRGEGPIRLPGRVSIARELIDAWVARGDHGA